MSASPLNFLRAGPPSPKVILLPDALFFSRNIPLIAGTAAAEVAAQVELALESIAPFPLAQLYYGFYHAPGSAHALAFASYRRRFTSEQTAAWADAELVLPSFAALLGGERAPGSTFILARPESLTALHTAADGSAQICTEPLLPEADDGDRARARENLIRLTGGSTRVIDLIAEPAAEPATNDGTIVFRAGDFVSRLPTGTAAALDVRDKTALTTLRRARARDVLFWRVALGCVAALVLLAIGEVALIGGRSFWQKSRMALFNAQKPTVDKIIAAKARTTRIEDLSTKKLLPLEMISLIEPRQFKSGIMFTRAVADAKDRDRLTVEAKTENAGEINPFVTAIKALPQVANAEISRQQAAQPGSTTTTFTLSVTFQPGAVQPAPKS